MSFAGITFANQNATPSDDGIIRRAMLEDGILTGCALSYTGSTLTMQPGQLILCGRQIRHPSVQNFAIVDATSGYARILITVDLTKTSTKEVFEQVDARVEYASTLEGFPALIQTDINGSGTMYQSVACVVSLSAGGISGIVSSMPQSSAGIGASGGTLTVTAPAGVTVTAAKDGKSYTRTANAEGKAVFKGLSGGTWAVTISDGQQVSAPVQVEIVADYAVEVSFFAATIAVTYPAGSTCTCSKGGTVLTAPDTTGSVTFTVPEAGDWVVSCTDGTDSATETVSITEDGQSATITLDYRVYLYNRGKFAEGQSLETYSTNGGTLTLNTDTYNVFVKQSSHFYMYFKNKVDLTDVQTIVVSFRANTTADGNAYNFGFKLFIDTDVGNNAVAQAEQFNVTAGTEYTLAVDVSSLTGEYYVKPRHACATGVTAGLDLDVYSFELVYK